MCVQVLNRSMDPRAPTAANGDETGQLNGLIPQIPGMHPGALSSALNGGLATSAGRLGFLMQC